MRRAHQLFVAGCCCCDSTPIYDGFCRHRDHEGRPSRAQFPTSLSRLDESSRRFLARRRPPRLTEAPSLGRGGTVRGTPAYARRVQRRRLARSQPPLAGLRRAFAALPAPKQTPRNTPLCGRRFLFSLLFSSSFSVSHLLLCAFPAAPPLARATGVCTDLETRTCVPAAFPLSPSSSCRSTLSSYLHKRICFVTLFSFHPSCFLYPSHSTRHFLRIASNSHNRKSEE